MNLRACATGFRHMTPVDVMTLGISSRAAEGADDGDPGHTRGFNPGQLEVKSTHPCGLNFRAWGALKRRSGPMGGMGG